MANGIAKSRPRNRGVQHQEVSLVAIEDGVTFRLRTACEVPLLDIAHHTDHLSPWTAVSSSLGIHLSKRILVGPENVRHLLIDDSGIDHLVELLRIRLGVFE